MAEEGGGIEAYVLLGLTRFSKLAKEILGLGCPETL
jgi:hypothetical protein